jgi:hypothetical protein
MPRNARDEVAKGKCPEQANSGMVLDETSNPAVDAADLLFCFLDLGTNPIAQIVCSLFEIGCVHALSPCV